MWANPAFAIGFPERSELFSHVLFRDRGRSGIRKPSNRDVEPPVITRFARLWSQLRHPLVPLSSLLACSTPWHRSTTWPRLFVARSSIGQTHPCFAASVCVSARNFGSCPEPDFRVPLYSSVGSRRDVHGCRHATPLTTTLGVTHRLEHVALELNGGSTCGSLIPRATCACLPTRVCKHGTDFEGCSNGRGPFCGHLTSGCCHLGFVLVPCQSRLHLLGELVEGLLHAAEPLDDLDPLILDLLLLLLPLFGPMHRLMLKAHAGGHGDLVGDAHPLVCIGTFSAAACASTRKRGTVCASGFAFAVDMFYTETSSLEFTSPVSGNILPCCSASSCS